MMRSLWYVGIMFLKEKCSRMLCSLDFMYTQKSVISSEGLAGEAVEVDKDQGLQLINCGLGGTIKAAAVI